MTDTTPSEPKTLMEIKAKKPTKPAAAPETLQDRVTAALNQQNTTNPVAPERGGAAEAAGVLTAIDEDGEGGEEAELPNEFEYHPQEHQEEEE